MTETDTQVVDPEVVDGEVVADTADQASGEEKSSPAKGRKSKAAAKATGKELVPAAKGEAAKADEPESSFTKAQARRLTGKLKGNLRASVELFMEAYDGRIWVPMGYSTWKDYLDSELGEYRIKLPAVERKELVEKMSTPKSEGGPGMSSRAIADTLGVDQKTVVNDRKGLHVDSERVDGDAKVVGQDGVEQPARKPTPPRAVSLADKFTTLFVPVDSNLGDLLALTTDERWEDEAAEVAKRHRADITRVVNTLTQIVKALPGS